MTPMPVGASAAIQYFVPETIVADGTVIEFHAPLTGLVIVPWVSNVPGESLALLAYKPTTIWVAAMLASKYK
jgi:hypothetical protein